MNYEEFEENELELFLTEYYNYEETKKILPSLQKKDYQTVREKTKKGIKKGIQAFLEKEKVSCHLYESDLGKFCFDNSTAHMTAIEVLSLDIGLDLLDDLKAYANDVCLTYRMYVYNDSRDRFLSVFAEKMDRYIRNGDLVEQVAGAWLSIFNQLGFAGFRVKDIYRKFDDMFGVYNWLPAHIMDGKVISRYEAYLIYEEAYYHFLKSHPQIREWIVGTASEVYDIQPSNVASGLDYTIQECGATHLQDISVRRVLTRLCLEEKGIAYDTESLPVIPIFKGDHLVQIRGVDSEGYPLNPGQVPFHKPESILPSDQSGWWNEGSAEDWYQKNKVLLVNPDVFYLSLVFFGPSKLYLAFNKRDHYHMKYESGHRFSRNLWYTKGNRARSLWCEDKTLTKVLKSPGMTHAEWERLLPTLRLSESASKRSVNFEVLKGG